MGRVGRIPCHSRAQHRGCQGSHGDRHVFGSEADSGIDLVERLEDSRRSAVAAAAADMEVVDYGIDFVAAAVERAEEAGFAELGALTVVG